MEWLYCNVRGVFYIIWLIFSVSDRGAVPYLHFTLHFPDFTHLSFLLPLHNPTICNTCSHYSLISTPISFFFDQPHSLQALRYTFYICIIMLFLPRYLPYFQDILHPKYTLPYLIHCSTIFLGKP